MTADEVKKLCADLKAKILEAGKSERRSPADEALFEIGMLAIEAHLVNQARIADNLGKLLVHVRSNP